MAHSQDPKDLFVAITSSLPNITHFVRVVLKKEGLSEEAEVKRQKYEVILNSLEQGISSAARPCSIVCDDDNSYFSANRNRVGENSEQVRTSTFVSYSGYLLWQDEKLRWHRCWCKAENRDMRFYVYEDNTEDVLLRSFSLENTLTHFEGPVKDLGKDNCFLIAGVLYDAIGGSSGNEMEASTSPVDVYFAAYTESEWKKWKDILFQLLQCCDSARTMLSTDGNAWLAPILSHDSASSSSSNFSSNRDSVVSNTSSLVSTFRVSSRSDIEGKDQILADDGKTFPSKQLQPLPLPPQVGGGGGDPAMTNVCDEDNISVGTIYESIDNLVLQFDDAIRSMGENIKSSAKASVKPKKKDRSMFRQHSFLSLRSRHSKSNLWSEKTAEFEKGERYSGFMFKKSNSGSWKRKWCVLKGCVFGYYKSRNDSQGRECIILNGKVEANIPDDKKNLVFCLSCTGVQQMFFAVEDDEIYSEWLSKLKTACNSASEYSHVLQAESDELSVNESSQFSDSIYNVPRVISDGQLYDTPRGSSMSHQVVMTPDAAVDAGIYNVPRALLMTPVDDSKKTTTSDDDPQYLLGANPLDIYDYPRVSLSPDDDGIYDDPLDIVDMEIYDYPPDASELGIEDPTLSVSESKRSSTAAGSGELAESNRGSFFAIDNSLAVPPLPSSARPSMAFTTEDNQNSRHFNELMYDRPKSQPIATFSENTNSEGGNVSTGIETTDAVLLEYGQCALRGYLYKKERFMTWIKLFCIIRNNFLECHKSQGDSLSPVMKLFLPGSEIKEGGGDAKKKWGFQVKHPRREGVLIFAADSEDDSHRWIGAFQSGASIQVQPVNTVEEIRITDLEMQKRWTTMDKMSTLPAPPSTEDSTGPIPPRRKTFSAGTGPEEFSTDTLKRRKKFSWVKSNFMRRKNDRKAMSGSQIDLNTNRLSSSTLGEMVNPPDPLRKSVSLEILPTATDSDDSSHDRKSVGSVLSDNAFQGYLRVQRKGADNVWVRYWCILENSYISCYISQRDLTLTLSIQLQGSKVAESEIECQRKHSFKILHVESGQCLFFAADSHEDFFRWFSEITKNGHHVISDDSSSAFGPFLSYYSIPKDSNELSFKRLSVVSEGGSSNVSDSSGTIVPHSTGNSVFYRGQLLKASHTGKWKQRYCVVSDGFMSMFHSSLEKSPITSIPLQGISLELTTTHDSKNEYQFKINPSGAAKCYMFAAPNETEMYAWISALRDASCVAPVVQEKISGNMFDSPSLPGKLSRRKSKKLKHADLISYIPASSIEHPDCSGIVDIQYGTEPWSKYWCVAYSNCLYIYRNQSSTSTVKTVVLPGYEVKVGELRSAKYAHNISLCHDGVAPVYMSVANKKELDIWASLLEKYTKVEGSVAPKKMSSKLIPSETKPKVLTHKVALKTSGGAKKGPVRADHKISGVKSAFEEVTGSESSLGATSKQVESLQDSTIHRYEKRIRKTHRVANQTEQKLKKQQTSLLHFKKELSRHVIKLQELSNSGDPHAQKRLKNVRTKLAQLDKIVPYLGKYISVNRQAEMQTIAVLKESCTVELQKLSQGKTAMLVSEQPDSDTLSSTPTQEPSIQQIQTDSQVYSTDEIQPLQVLQQSENPYASLSEIRKEASNPIKLRSNYAELDFQKIQGGEKLRPPSVKYSEVRIDAMGIGRILPDPVSPLVPQSTLQEQEALLDVTITPQKFVEDQSCTPVVDSCATEHRIVSASPEAQIVSTSPETQKEIEDLCTSSTFSEQTFSPSHPQSIDSNVKVEEMKNKSPPPPVSKKPSPRHKVLEKCGNASHTGMGSQEIETSSNADTNVLSPIHGVPSVSERIKALQHQQ